MELGWMLNHGYVRKFARLISRVFELFTANRQILFLCSKRSSGLKRAAQLTLHCRLIILLFSTPTLYPRWLHVERLWILLNVVAHRKIQLLLVSTISKPTRRSVRCVFRPAWIRYVEQLGVQLRSLWTHLFFSLRHD